MSDVAWFSLIYGSAAGGLLLVMFAVYAIAELVLHVRRERRRR